jgi:hypothetical protein
VARVLSTAFCVALLAATAGAFALTQGAKTELVPIFRTHVDKVFSPNCRCDTRAARIDFRLRRTDRLTVWIENGDGDRVSTLVPGRTYHRGDVALVFDGIDPDGVTLPDGDYTPVVHLAREHRTIRLPNTIVLDTKPPRIKVRHRIYTHISPDGDGHHDSFKVAYKLNEPGNGILIVDGHQVELRRGKSNAGTLVWNGRINGRLARPGNHVLEISARDAAGNRTRPFPFAVVAVRYVRLGRDRVLVRPGGRFALLVLSDSPHVTLRWGGGTRTVRPGTLHLRAPAAKGVYRLYLVEGDHAARALVVVG